VIKQETQEGRSAIQNLLNWRKLNEGHAAGEGKIGGPWAFLVHRSGL